MFFQEVHSCTVCLLTIKENCQDSVQYIASSKKSFLRFDLAIQLI